MSIGLFFGSFNPIHLGHLIVAHYCLEFCSLREVWFITSPDNPFKTLLSERIRLELVRRSIADDPRFCATEFQFDLPKPTNNSDMLQELKAANPGTKFTILMGSDNAMTLRGWREPVDFLNENRILVFPRVDTTSERRVEHANVSYVKAEITLHISSSFIRKAIASGKNMAFLLHPAANSLIMDRQLYATFEDSPPC